MCVGVEFFYDVVDVVFDCVFGQEYGVGDLFVVYVFGDEFQYVCFFVGQQGLVFGVGGVRLWVGSGKVVFWLGQGVGVLVGEQVELVYYFGGDLWCYV